MRPFAGRSQFRPVIRDIRTGISTFFEALPWALRNGLWWAFIVPAVLWIALTFGLYAVLEPLLKDLLPGVWAANGDPAAVAGPGDAQGIWNTIKGTLQGAGAWIAGLLVRLAVAYALFVVNRYIVLIVLSPLLAFVSERTEALLTGRTYPFSVRQFMHDAWRGARIALRNVVLEVLVTCAIWLVVWSVPVLAPGGFVLLFLVSAYFSGYSMFDYVHERRRLGVRETDRAIHARAGLVIGNGACFVLLLRVPLLGLCAAPALAAIGAVHATVRSVSPGGSGASTFGASGT